MSESKKKPLIIKVPKPKSQKELRRERISHWEDERHRSCEDVLECMIETFQYYVNKYPKHFYREIEKINDPKFLARFRKYALDTINEYVDFTSGYTQTLARENAEDWKFSERKISELYAIYSILPKKHRHILSVTLEMNGYAPLSDELVRSFKRARMLAARHTRTFEARGSKRSPASFLAVALFENLEICFKRELIRSFGIARGKLSIPSATGTYPQPAPQSGHVFTNPDAELIHLLALQVDERATARIVSGALRPMDARK